MMTAVSAPKPSFATIDGAKIHLVALGQKLDSEIDLIEAGFALALIEKPDTDIQKYRTYINECHHKLKTIFDDLCAVENSDDTHVMAKALAQFMAEDQGYLGDDIHYDDFKNINLFDVIDRRLGLPITLCILTIGFCRAQGWQADGINFPGHFIMRLEKDGERLMIDPFQGCKVLEAKDLRLILKRIMGEYAELSADYYNACPNRDIILRLQNNKKYRLIDQEHYQDALDVVDAMTWVAPDDYRLCLDSAVLLSRLEQPMGAIENIKKYINHVQDPHDKAEAEQFLHQLQNQLN